MLWIDRKAATVGQPFASASKISTASSRPRPDPPTSSRAMMPASPKAAAALQRLDRKVLRLVPIERMGRDGLGREARGHVADRNLIVVEVEVHVTETS